MCVCHLEWGTAHYEGRLAIRTFWTGRPADDRVETKTLQGSDFPARGLGRLVRDLYPGAKWSPPFPYRVEYRRGLSGCADFWVRIARSWEWRDFPIVGGVHISQTGRLNRGLRAPLWVVSLLAEYEPGWFDGARFRYFIVHWPRWEPEDFINPEHGGPQPILLEGPNETLATG